jgi:hypothetical protein
MAAIVARVTRGIEEQLVPRVVAARDAVRKLARSESKQAMFLQLGAAERDPHEVGSEPFRQPAAHRFQPLQAARGSE